jgi:hypothetical protein
MILLLCSNIIFILIFFCKIICMILIFCSKIICMILIFCSKIICMILIFCCKIICMILIFCCKIICMILMLVVMLQWMSKLWCNNPYVVEGGSKWITKTLQINTRLVIYQSEQSNTVMNLFLSIIKIAIINLIDILFSCIDM